MSDRTMQADPSDDALVSAIDRWSSQAGLSDMVGRRDATFLILDAGGDRVLRTSSAALSLRAGLAGVDGLVARALNLPGQIGAAVRTGERPRLVRLRLDPRGIARPTTCLVARAALDESTSVLILSPVGPVPALRPLAAAPDSSLPPVEPAAAGEGDAQTVPIPPRQDGRFVWRSDGDDVLRQVSGDEAVSRTLTGRSWPELFEQGTVEGERLSAAIAGRATFRALPAVLVVAGAAIELDLSGVPSTRPHRPFAGFSGFGLIRARRLEDPVREADARSRHNGGTCAHSAADHGTIDHDPAWRQADQMRVVELQAEIAAQAPAETAALSVHEHAAFREIARTLGARFAGDDPVRQGGDPVGQGPVSEPGRLEPPVSASLGSVMPFPVPSRMMPAVASPADLLAGLPVGALVHRDTALLFANRRFLVLTGLLDLAALNESDSLAPLLRGSLPGETEAEGPVTVPSAAGGTVELLLDRAGIVWEGRVANLLLARPAPTAPPRELAAQEMAADTIRAEAARVLDSLPDGVLTLDEAGRVLSLNGRAAALLGRPAQEIAGDTVQWLFSGEAGPAIGAAVARAERGGTGEVEVVSRHGEDAPVPLSLRVVRLPEGRARFCATVRDRSEVAAGEAEIARRSDALTARKADFLAKVSHEIRTPLNDILGFADVMLTEPYGPIAEERAREYLRDIHASSSYTLRVVDDLLDLARIEAGRVDLSFTDIPLNDLVSGCIATMQPQAARDRIVVRTSFAPDLKTLVADERSMRQAALTVIANAIRFTEAGGQVIVSTMIAERGEIALRVRDTGVGMTSEEVENALHPFERIGVAGSPPGGGAGLGLTLTKALVEANHGRFRITSRKHEGTLVEMVFPPAEARRA